MQKVDKKKLYRIIDANFNRAKEGLRVCEDICRFIFDQQSTTKRFKTIRHQLTQIMSTLELSKILESRDVGKDVGKQSISVEFKREKVKDIFFANLQRVKESIRVLEEFVKLWNKKRAQDLKMMRYKIYDLEKKFVEQC